MHITQFENNFGNCPKTFSQLVLTTCLAVILVIYCNMSCNLTCREMHIAVALFNQISHTIAPFTPNFNFAFCTFQLFINTHLPVCYSNTLLVCPRRTLRVIVRINCFFTSSAHFPSTYKRCWEFLRLLSNPSLY